MKLPCRHQLVKNLNKIDIPIEYLRIKCNSLYETNYEISPCIVKKINVEELKLNVQEVIDELKARDGTTEILNQIAYMGMMFLKHGKCTWKRTPHRWNPTPGRIKYSHFCNKYKNKSPKHNSINVRKMLIKKNLSSSCHQILNNSNDSNNANCSNNSNDSNCSNFLNSSNNSNSSNDSNNSNCSNTKKLRIIHLSFKKRTKTNIDIK